MAESLDRLAAALADRYRIERELGQGGMATVYLAEDLKHDRKVALKVLRPELAAVLGAERFVVEIKTTASLQHPHILPLFDSGTADGFLYYVMPFVEGETLRDRLNRETQLAVEEAVRITTEVADALDYAHRHGVIHRDIKPENILLHDGRPMVADFGIALAVSAAAGGRMTETGLSLGTPHYMSPEQATAEKDITARSDVYSLASVLYEMLAGQPPHLGGSAQQIIMRIIAEPVAPVTTLRKSVPPNVAAALTKALEKVPADRFDGAKAFAAALTDPHYSLAATASATGGGARDRWKSVALGAVGAVVVLLVVTLWAFAGWRRANAAAATPPPVVRMYVEGDSTFSISNHCCGPSIAISDDGSRMVFLAQTADGLLYYRRDLDETEAHPIPGTTGGSTPFLSPDGRWLGFVRDSALMKVDLSGGAPLKIADAGAGRVWGASWADDGTIYFTPETVDARAIYRVSAQGGTPQLVSAPDTNVEAARAKPFALPGGHALLYVSWPKNGGDAGAAIMLLDLDHGSTRRLVAGVEPAYAAGHLVYVLPDGTLMSRSFDARSGEVGDAPISLGVQVVTHDNADAEYAVSRVSGTVVSRESSAVPSELRLYSLDGALLQSFPAALLRMAPRFSPDGRRIVYLQASDKAVNGLEVWEMDLRTRLDQRLSDPAGSALSAIWSADGRSVRWEQSLGQGRRRLLTRPADLSGPAVRFGNDTILPDSVVGFFGLASRGGGPIPFTRPPGDLWVLNADGTGLRPFLATPARERDGAVSPSGKWIAYSSGETGRDEIYVQPFPSGGAQHRLSADGGRYPVWASDTSLVYVRGDGAAYVQLDFGADGVRPAGTRLIATPLLSSSGVDVSPDGKSVLVAASVGTNRLLVETNRVRHVETAAGGHE